jgi:predicted RNA-binding Zn-ribbon protein involved in translation (DUF1610 family)
MSIFIDRTFLLRVSPKLQRFTQKKTDLYNFRCPLCGDSTKNKTKSRGYIFGKKNNYFYMCHNCGASTNFYNFLEKVDPSLLQEYALERYKNSDGGTTSYAKPEFEELKEKPVFKTKLNLPDIASLPDEHYAKQYVVNRQIPEKFYTELYFTDDFKKFVEQDLKVEKDGLIDDDPRLIIPFYDEDKNLVSVQGRALGKSKLRYITVKIDKDNHKIYGLDRINKEEKVYITEGPIDSMFLENAGATADSNLKAAARHIDKDKLVLVYDNEPRNKDICKQIENAIEEHYNVVIWPEWIEEKDVNEMVLAGFGIDEINDIISKHTFVNLRAKMEFVNWKKV